MIYVSILGTLGEWLNQMPAKHRCLSSNLRCTLNKVNKRIKMNYDWNLIQSYYDSGLMYREIVEIFDISYRQLKNAEKLGLFKFRTKEESSLIRYFKYDKQNTKRLKKYNWEEIQKYYDDNHTWRDLQHKFGLASASIHKAVNRGDLLTRDKSIAINLARTLHGAPKHTEESKSKLRCAAIKNMEGKFGRLCPSYNSEACKIFELINEELNWKGLHAENGGEFHIKKLGYFVDYYEPNLNIVIEFDEKEHEREKRKIKDMVRQNQIIEELKCKFYRIKETDSLDCILTVLKQID